MLINQYMPIIENKQAATGEQQGKIHLRRDHCKQHLQRKKRKRKIQSVRQRVDLGDVLVCALFAR